jgi:hypothetical protein
MDRRLLVLVVGLVALVALTQALAPPAHAAPAQAPAPQSVSIGLVDPPASPTGDPRAKEYIVDHLAPGATIHRQVEISNDSDVAQPVEFYTAAADIGGGQFRFGEGRAANELTGWTSINPSSVSVARRSKTRAAVTIAVPADAKPGERYGVVWAALTATPAAGGVISVNRVGVRIYLSIGSGPQPASNFVVSGLSAGRGLDGSSLVTATVRNSGGRAVDLFGQLTLSNGPAGRAAGPFGVAAITLGVGQSQTMVVTVDPNLPAGPWDARMTVRSGTAQHDAKARIALATGAAAPRPSAGHPSVVPWLAAAAGALLVVGLLVLLLMRRRPAPPARLAPTDA